MFAALHAMKGGVVERQVLYGIRCSTPHFPPLGQEGCCLCPRRRPCAEWTAAERQCAGLQQVDRCQSRRVVERRWHCIVRRREGAGALQGAFQSGRRASYTVSATCATASGRAAQTATVRQVGSNRYSGRFYNSEYSISGVIDIIVHGSSQIVRLTSESASGVLYLSR